jgi:hypothetical protein
LDKSPPNNRIKYSIDDIMGYGSYLVLGNQNCEPLLSPFFFFFAKLFFDKERKAEKNLVCMNKVDQNRVIWWFEGKRASSFLLLENPVRKKKKSNQINPTKSI